MEEIIKVENLCFEYEPGLQTISNISFQIHKGEYVAILGHNGSGKSTIADVYKRQGLASLKTVNEVAELREKTVDEIFG